MFWQMGVVFHVLQNSFSCKYFGQKSTFGFCTLELKVGPRCTFTCFYKTCKEKISRERIVIES